MDAEVAPRLHAPAGAPEDQVLVEEAGGDRTALGDVAREGDHVPVVDQHRVLEHGPRLPYLASARPRTAEGRTVQP